MKHAPHSLMRLAMRVFNTPLMIERHKLEVLLGVLGERVGLQAPSVAFDAEALQEIEAKKASQRVESLGAAGSQIAVIDVSGTLVNRTGGFDAYSGLTSYESISQQLEDALADGSVGGILMRFDSPGGDCSGVYELADEIFAARGRKPIWASVDDAAFSAAYLLASACERIYVTRTGGVGSIGVIATHVDVSGWDQKAGLKYTTLFAGDRKNDFSPHEPLKDEARLSLGAEIDRLYGLFVSSVARYRGIAESAVRKTEAGLYFGEDGVRVGLADYVGTFKATVGAMAREIPSLGASIHVSGAAATGLLAAVDCATQEVEMEQTELSADQLGAPIMAAEPAAVEEPAAAVPTEEPTEDPEEEPAAAVPTEEPTEDPDEDTDEEPAAAVPTEEPTEDPEEDEGTDEEPAAAAALQVTPVAAAGAAVATMEQVFELCAVAGVSAQEALRLASQNLTVPEVREQLLAARADQEERIFSIVSPTNMSADNFDSIERQAAAVAAQTGRSKAQIVADMLKQNPAIYEAYLAQKARPAK